MVFIIFGTKDILKTINLSDEEIKILRTKNCGFCGAGANFYYNRYDRYFTLFFIRIFRLKKGLPFYTCSGCELVLLVD
ncbi:hypothetical protein CWI36_0316p0050 [Hamiltosporidium magnivora]|uniref:Zinc-ribbon 15 domain-containing protein n=1 Tax=Hamiltosporidium magnivora TaxID=148818 RepID=A0A4Q9LGU7_9MICR|nr:hypothetical protein CWI36_0316p0050 [Hamiltosporidium magnivora]